MSPNPASRGPRSSISVDKVERARGGPGGRARRPLDRDGVEPQQGRDQEIGAGAFGRVGPTRRSRSLDSRPTRSTRSSLATKTTASSEVHCGRRPTQIPVARLGDAFQLGSHRLICGSGSEPETPRLLMEGAGPARLGLTDEPYNVPIAGHVTGGRHRVFAMASGEMTTPNF